MMLIQMAAEHATYLVASLPLGAAVLSTARRGWIDRREHCDSIAEGVFLRGVQEERELWDMDLDEVREILEKEAWYALQAQIRASAGRTLTGSSDPASTAVDTLADTHGVPSDVISNAVSSAVSSYTAES